MYDRIRRLLFHLPPEQAHALTLQGLRLLGALPPLGVLLRSVQEIPDWPVEVFGLRFRNPVGLAAGYDKDGLGWRGLAALGFGHLELGTVTLRPQPGNPSPRLFRLPEDRALINRMGFPGRGAGFLAARLMDRPANAPLIGVNLGKNKDTSLEGAVEEYVQLTRAFAALADYLAINISSPNTQGLRRLQERAELEGLLAAVVRERRVQEERLFRRAPLLVKLAPDLDDGQLDQALEAITHAGVEGVIAANTTLSRPELRSALAPETGGLSGAPLGSLSTQMIRKISRWSGGKLPVIGVGGILSAQDALEKLEAGASLVQLYTGLVYAGPGLVGQICRRRPGRL
jgi:dihydroorotate dehydrogenase